MNTASYPPEWRRTKATSAHTIEEWAYDVFDPDVLYYKTEVWVRLRVVNSKKRWEIVLRDWVTWRAMPNVHTVDEAKAVALAMLATE